MDGHKGQAWSPFAYLSATVTHEIGLGLELRYADLRVDGFRVGASGNLLGLGVAITYRTSL